jgi:hypothetical protein
MAMIKIKKHIECLQRMIGATGLKQVAQVRRMVKDPNVIRYLYRTMDRCLTCGDLLQTGEQVYCDKSSCRLGEPKGED